MRSLAALPALALLAASAGTSQVFVVEPLLAPEGTAVPLGTAVQVGDLTAKPLQVIEDSRCPENARCVWAGRLLVRTNLASAEGSETAVLTLGVPHVTYGATITLVGGRPKKQANRATAAATYRFTFRQGRQLSVARLGERMMVDGPEVTPMEVLEDSRCPATVTCVSAGRVRLRATIHLGSGDQIRELVLGEPVQVADGALKLVAVQPPPRGDGGAIAPADYRFTVRFDGGL
jgi:hypothetical protein